jgi:hypothetical protein
MAAIEISAKKEIQIRSNSNYQNRIKKKLTNITETFVNNRRISKNCDIFEDQKAQLI